MSFRWPNKDPDEQLDYSMDWSRFLGTATISSVVWSVNNSSHNQTATINLGSGTNNTEYTFFCRITDNSGSQAERSVKLKVRDK